MEGLSLFIADGHHRYETALNYSLQMKEKSANFNGNEAYSYVMMYLSNMDDEGMVILPCHRLLCDVDDFDPSRFGERAADFFHIEEFGFNSGNELEVRRELFARLEKNGERQHTFGMYVKGANHYTVLTLKSEELVDSGVMDNIPPVLRRLDVNIFQTFVLKGIFGINDQNMESQKNVTFIEDADAAIELVEKDKYQLVFLMNPTKIKQVNDAACARVRMPQKSTFFYPKLSSGLVLNSIEGVVSG